jgi:hypothetical protein
MNAPGNRYTPEQQIELIKGFIAEWEALEEPVDTELEEILGEIQIVLDMGEGEPT